MPRETYYRAQRKASDVDPDRKRAAPPRVLSDRERQEVCNVLHSERFVDKSPAEVHATLLDMSILLT